MTDRHSKNRIVVMMVMMAVAFDDDDALMIAVMVMMVVVFGNSHQPRPIRLARRIVLPQRGRCIRNGREQIGVRRCAQAVARRGRLRCRGLRRSHRGQGGAAAEQSSYFFIHVRSSGIFGAGAPEWRAIAGAPNNAQLWRGFLRGAEA